MDTLTATVREVVSDYVQIAANGHLTMTISLDGNTFTVIGFGTIGRSAS